MFRMSRLKTCNETAELRFVEPLGYQPPQPSGTFRRVEVISAMQCMPREGRVALAGYHQHISHACHLRAAEETQEINARHLDTGAMKVEAALDLDLATREFLCGAAIKTSDLWWWLLQRRGHVQMRS